MQMLNHMCYCVFYNIFFLLRIFTLFLKFQFMRKKTIRKFPKLKTVSAFKMV